MTNFFRESEFNISSEEIISIKEKLNDLISIEIADKCGFTNENSPTDLPTRKIKYISKSKTDSTYLYFTQENELPDNLDNFIRVFQQIIAGNDTLKN